MKRIILSLLIFSWFGLFAQRAAVQKGDLSVESYEYGQAIRFYNEALAKEPKPEVKQYIYGQVALCYTKLFQYTKAEEYFGMLMGSGAEVKPEWYLEYGNVLKLNGKYPEAKNQFVKYQEYSKDAGMYVQSVEWAMSNEAVKNNTYRIFLTNLDVSGQSLGYCFYGSGLIYSHGRNKVSTGKSTKAIFDIDYAINENSLEFTGRSNFFSKINFEWNEISPSITADETQLYFAANATRLKDKNEKGGLELNEKGIANYKIYVATKRDAEFQYITELPFNDPDFSCIHPCIVDGITLIFSSDKPGGFGGFDLYRSTLSKDSIWGDPVNMGPTVNSAENEIFPWVNSSLLFFSSKGFNGYGGYDIFIAGLNTELIPQSLKNIGLPINSFRDDVAYITNDSGASGYFSSNRNTDNGADQVYFFKESQAGKLAFNSVDGFDGKNKLRKQSLDSLGNTALKSIDRSQMIGFKAAPGEETKRSKKKRKTASAETVKPEGGVTPALIAAAAVVVVEDKNVPVTVPIVDSIPSPEKPDQTQTDVKPVAVKSAPVATKKQEPVTHTVSSETIQEFPPILFKFNETQITSVQKHTADSLVILFKKKAGQKIQIDAYTDSRGSMQYNIGLSNRRAYAVKQYLIQKGIPAGKISTKGWGEKELLNECADGVSCSEKQHAKNRRVVMKLITK